MTAWQVKAKDKVRTTSTVEIVADIDVGLNFYLIIYLALGF